jgi:hypothetical protein
LFARQRLRALPACSRKSGFWLATIFSSTAVASRADESCPPGRRIHAVAECSYQLVLRRWDPDDVPGLFKRRGIASLFWFRLERRIRHAANHFVAASGDFSIA